MKNLVLALIVLAVFSGCKKDIDELPPATETGANTFGAKVDGELWVPQKFGVAPSAPILEARYGGNSSLFINARNFSSSPTETEFEIHIKNFTGTGTYQLNQVTNKYPYENASYGYFIKRKLMPLNDWITTNQFTGNVVVTKYDSTNKIVAGTFSFTAGSTDNTAEPLVVTEGRFDVKIQ
ncbi:MAG: DUF6252 family protein [Flavisolibacter sp.]